MIRMLGFKVIDFVHDGKVCNNPSSSTLKFVPSAG